MIKKLTMRFRQNLFEFIPIASRGCNHGHSSRDQIYRQNGFRRNSDHDLGIQLIKRITFLSVSNSLKRLVVVSCGWDENILI